MGEGVPLMAAVASNESKQMLHKAISWKRKNTNHTVGRSHCVSPVSSL